MASTSETGHAINIANFKLLIDNCTQLGKVYAPGNPQLTVSALTDLWAQANALSRQTDEKARDAKMTINQREKLFAPLDKLVTRILNAFASSAADKKAVQDAKSIADRIRGYSVKVKKDSDGNPDPNHVSNSQLSYVQRTNAFIMLITLLEKDGNYAPTEDSLALENLKVLAEQMEKLNAGMGVATTPATDVRGQRDIVLYGDDTGMLAIAQKVKQYCKSLPAEHTAIVQSITAIRFRKMVQD